MNKCIHRILSIVLGLILLASAYVPGTAQSTPAAGLLKPRWVFPKPAHTEIMEGQSRDVIEVKFAEGTSYRLRGGGLTTLGNDDLSGIQAVISQYPLKSIERLFFQSEDEISKDKLALEAKTHEQMADLNLWYRFIVEEGTDAGMLIDALNALPEVEIAYPAPLPAPLPTPSYVPNQRYLNFAPVGIGAKYAWSLPGGNGKNVRIVDVEYSFNTTHEDLPSIPILQSGQLYQGYGDDHGTAVLGELVARKNTYGVTGIAYRAVAMFAPACMSSIGCNYNPANAINVARTATSRGDVILIEQQLPVCGLSGETQSEGPAEYYQSIYDAIKFATTAGRHVVEAAGNGHVNLDAANCLNVFNRAVRDSGAIIVGAGAPPNYTQIDRSRLDFSSYGSRVDVQGWGHSVVTTGYGWLYQGTGKNQWYMNDFSGTSSSSPVVAGAVALLSSMAEERGTIYSPTWMRKTLVNTGSPQQAAAGFPLSQHIGPRPDLARAIKRLTPGFSNTFSGSAPGWYGVQGSWSFDSTNNYLFTPGILDKWSSVFHSGDYPTLDYQAGMARTGCFDCSNGLVIRGTVNPQFSNYFWNQGYMFLYTNSKWFSIWKTLPTGSVALKNWTSYAGIVPNGWNRLRVVAQGTTLKFYINDVLVWSGADAALTTGKVGVIEHRYNDTVDLNPDGFWVDYAYLITSLASPALDEVPVETGPEVTGWTDPSMAPPR